MLRGASRASARRGSLTSVCSSERGLAIQGAALSGFILDRLIHASSFALLVWSLLSMDDSVRGDVQTPCASRVEYALRRRMARVLWASSADTVLRLLDATIQSLLSSAFSPSPENSLPVLETPKDAQSWGHPRPFSIDVSL